MKSTPRDGSTSSPQDVFMHLLQILTLYGGATAFLTLLFQLINSVFPDPLNPYFDPGGPMRWAIAALVVIFPVFLWTSRALEKDLSQQPERRELRIRKWLLYFTLFAAALFIIGDLVALIYNFLEGELTARFILKALSILIVSGIIFWYYLNDLRREARGFGSPERIFVWSVITIVIATVVYGFFVAGSPFRQRLVRFDERKVNDLQMIQVQIINFWTQKGRLPNSLDDLRDSISGFVPPRDPQSSEAYVYGKAGDLSFRLCATFNRPNLAERAFYKLSAPMIAWGENWDHEAGRQCFDRTVDPELYKQQPKR
ncbi:hypothetical protein HY504_02050 [Candidatus Wolfebacteria bacterium]|nr:hypothetical protein [Candidatus Wolfebacteria bacterium]